MARKRSVVNEEKELYEKRNTDDVFARVVIGGLLNALNGELFYTQVRDGKEEVIHIPFFYNMAHSGERFIQDNYMFFKDLCKGMTKMDGSFDIIPRGVITLNSSSIEAGSITNRFVLGEYTRTDEDGIPRTYVSYLYSLPIKFSFDCKIIVDTTISLLKIQSQVNEAFYKNRSFKTTYRGIVIRCRYGIPENSQWQKPMEYKFGMQDASPMELSFSIDVEAYQPMFDKATERLKSNYIKSFGYDVTLNKSERKDTLGQRDGHNEIYGLKSDIAHKSEDGYIYPRYDISGKAYPAGHVMPITWHYDKVYGDMRTISISYNENGKETHIATIPNTMLYDWEIPDDFIPEEERTDAHIDYFDAGDISQDQVILMPDISVVPDMENGKITENSFIVNSQGLFVIGDKTDEQRRVLIKYTKRNGQEITFDAYLNLNSGIVDMANPITLPRNHEPIPYVGSTAHRTIDIVIKDAQNNGISCTIKDVTII